MARRSNPGWAQRACMVIGYLAAIGLGVKAQQGQSPPIDILAQRGCDVGTALIPNMQECVIDQLMGSNGTLTLTFNIAAKSKHSVLLTLRSVGGIAEMRLLDSGNSLFGGQVVYFNDAITESFIRVDADQLTTGQYTLVIQGMGGATQKLLLYLRVQTPAANVRLAAGDKAALQSVLAECCPPATAATGPNGPQGPPFCTQFLPGALAAKTVDADICNIGDFVCDKDGHLQKVDFGQADLDCKKGFPSAFGQLPSLETLMLRFNNFNGDTLDNVAAVLSGSRHLRRLMIGSANLTGTVPCALFQEHELKTLMMSSNKLEGTLPACVLEDPNIEELYMSQTTLSGPLPDSLTPDSRLKVWYSINADPRTGETPGPGFSGDLPSSISNSQALQYVELSNHQLTGGVPPLPPNIVMFEVQNNQLDGGIACDSLPASLVYLDVDNNTLTGPVPDCSQSPPLTLLDLSSNQLTGSVPSSFGAAGQNLVYLDMSRNTLDGNVNEGNQWEKLPQIQYLLLAENNLEGFVPASLAANKQLVALNLGSNKIEGDLTAFADAIPPALSESPQRSGGRRLQAATTVGRDASRLIARKLFGGAEDTITPMPTGWQYDIENVKALATHDVYAARRRLQQAPADATPAPAAPGTAATATRPAAATPAPATATPAPAAPQPKVTTEAPAAGGATTTTMAATPSGAAAPAASDTVPMEPTAAAQATPQDQATASGSGSASGDNSALGPTAASQAATPQQTQVQPSQDQTDIGLMPIPTSSQLQGNNFLYLNLSGNAITGGVPDQMRNLEMFRNPANSSDPYDMYVANRGGPDRILDLTNNRLYGEFPLFLIELGNLQDGCSCTTTFNVTDGNFLYCPTKATMAGVQLTKEEMYAIRANNYTCLLPKEGPDQPAKLADYLSKPANWLTAIPAASDVVTEKQLKTREPDHSLTSAPASEPSGGGSGSGGSAPSLGPGAIAGIVVGAVAGVGIIASLAYFVGYKKLYRDHRATSFKRGELPDGPAMGGAGPYPAAAYGPQPGAHPNGTPGFDIETPTPVSTPLPAKGPV